MAEPSLSELANVSSDPSLGTQGMTSFVPNTRDVNQRIYDSAKTKAAYDWQKYTTFLQNYKDIAKTGQDIAQMDIAPNDKEQLQKQMADIFSSIEKDPRGTLGGAKIGETFAALNKLTSQATQSKQDNAFDTYHRKFLELNPSMGTEENKAKVNSFLPSQPLGAREKFILESPQPEFDAEALFGGILKNSTHPFSENNINPKDEAGLPIKGYIQTETGEEINPKAVTGLWNLAISGHPETAKAIQKRYNDLPAGIKKTYDANGGVKTFFQDLGNDYLKAHFPEGSYTPTTEGNYRFNKKSTLVADPNYLGGEKLAEQIRHNKAQEALDRSRLSIDRDKLNQSKVPSQIAESAKEYALKLSDKLRGLSVNGQITGDNLKKLTEDEKKYLGIGTTFDNKYSLEPLKVNDNTKIKVNPDGTFEVVDAIIQDGLFKDGKTRVTFDVKQIATNKLSDEMTVSSGKEGFNFNNLKDLYGTSTNEEPEIPQNNNKKTIKGF